MNGTRTRTTTTTTANARRRQARNRSKVVTVYRSQRTSKKKSTKSRKNRRSKLGSQSGFARSLADPFNYGECVPDGSTGTGCWTIKQTITLQTGDLVAGGNSCGVYMAPVPNALFAVDTGSNKGTANYPSTVTYSKTSVTTAATLYRSYRCYGMAARATYIGSTMNDNGVILAGQIGEGANAQLAMNGYGVAQISNGTQYYKTVSLRNGVEIVWRPQDADDVELFEPLNTVDVFVGTPMNVPTIFLQVFGAVASSAILQVEMIWRFQGQTLNQNFSTSPTGSDFVRHAEIGWYEKAKAFVNTISPIQPVVNQFANMALNSAMNYSQNIVRDSLRSGRMRLEL